MNTLFQEYKKYLTNAEFVESFFLSIFFLLSSIIINFYAAQYATISASSSVTDIILSNTQARDVDGLFVFGAMALVVFIIVVCLMQPRRIPFALKSIALFVLVRSIFITLTHIGPFPTEIVLDKSTIYYGKEIIGTRMFNALFAGNDLFFSGHTGLPFIMAFICWDNKWLRYTFIALSVMFGVTVLLGHLHYSIDVLAAFFITASIFSLAKIFFRRDYERGVEGKVIL